MNRHFFVFFICFVVLFIGCNNTKGVRKDTIPSHNSETIKIANKSISKFIDISCRSY